MLATSLIFVKRGSTLSECLNSSNFRASRPIHIRVHLLKSASPAVANIDGLAELARWHFPVPWRAYVADYLLGVAGPGEGREMLQMLRCGSGKNRVLRSNNEWQ